MTDRGRGLWGSFAVLTTSPLATDTARELRFYFSGDTGYRSFDRGFVETPEALAALPHCPAFKDIGACGAGTVDVIVIEAARPHPNLM